MKNASIWFLARIFDKTEVRKMHRDYCKAVKVLVHSAGGQQVPLQTTDGHRYVFRATHSNDTVAFLYKHVTGDCIVSLTHKED